MRIYTDDKVQRMRKRISNVGLCINLTLTNTSYQTVIGKLRNRQRNSEGSV